MSPLIRVPQAKFVIRRTYTYAICSHDKASAHVQSNSISSSMVILAGGNTPERLATL